MDTPTLISLISLILSVLAVAISAMTFILQYWIPGKVEIYVGDSLQIVHTLKKNKIQLNCNFTNRRPRGSVINKVVAQVKSPNGNIYPFDWFRFYKFIDGQQATSTSIPTSLSVMGGESVLQSIEFRHDGTFDWIEGRYKITIYGWFVNKEMKKRLKCYISIIKSTAEKLKDTSRAANNATKMSQISIEYS